jgi:tetratricopeptide (TPR) repeat protein
MAERIQTFNTRTLPGRILLVVPLVLALASGWFAVRWLLGNTIAEYVIGPNSSLEAAARAVALAPSDPLTHSSRAGVLRHHLPPDALQPAVAEYEQAVRLSPNDYRYWVSLGTALEQEGDLARSEAVLRRAVQLAPAYALPHWYLGNALLRAGKNDEAFVELRLAAAADHELLPQVFNLAWHVYGTDVSALTAAVGSQPQTRAEFSDYLMKRQRFDDGLQLWRSLGADDQIANRGIGESLIGHLTDARRYHQALEIANDLMPAGVSKATIGQVLNGDFESAIPPGKFTWQATSVPQIQIAIDPAVGHNGPQSLRLVFKIRAKLQSMGVSQLVAVDPEGVYDLEFYVRTEKLQSGGTPLVSVVNAADGQVLASSPAAPSGDNDWRLMNVSFKTPVQSEAIVVRIDRGSCGDDAVCPMFGSIWYDDFNLERRK